MRSHSVSPSNSSRRQSTGLSLAWLAWQAMARRCVARSTGSLEVEFGRRTTAECGTELEVEDGGDLLREGPRDNRKISTRAGDRRFRGARMVGMTGDAALVEDEEHIGMASFDHCVDIRAKGV